ncbi:unnamed protein product [Paramecium primaurelia]|uniref:Uncharacterized protein n=1 Tax=Paramecium primaurelia TaxID=5886 RepID=A0A8S1JN85_PARPR|nr:unnamed protein product [Paramecium primaurelia]
MLNGLANINDSDDFEPSYQYMDFYLNQTILLVYHEELCKKQKNTMICIQRIRQLKLWWNHSILEGVERRQSLLKIQRTKELSSKPIATVIDAPLLTQDWHIGIEFRENQQIKQLHITIIIILI